LKSIPLKIGALVKRSEDRCWEHRIPNPKGSASPYSFHSLKTHDEIEAIEKAVKNVIAMQGGKDPYKKIEYKLMRLRELIKDYFTNYVREGDTHATKTLSSYTSVAKQVNSWMGNLILHEITTTAVREYLNKLSDKRNVSAATLNRHASFISGLLTYAVDCEYLQINVMRKFKRYREVDKRRRQEVFTEDETLKIIESAKESLSTNIREFIITAFKTGMRKDELFRLQWKYVDLEEGKITVIDTKNKEDRVIVISEGLLETLREYKKTAIKSKYVFPNKKGGIRTDIKVAWRNIIKRAGIEYRTFHTIRHTFTTNLNKQRCKQGTCGEDFRS